MTQRERYIAAVVAVVGLACSDHGLSEPSSDEFGWSYISDSEWFQTSIYPSLSVGGYNSNDGANSLLEADEPFAAARARAELEIYLGDHVLVVADGVADQGHVPAPDAVEARLQQGYLQVAPFTGLDLKARAGKFVTPFGIYPQRHGGVDDSFIRPPLTFDHRTVLGPTETPGKSAGLLTWRDDDEKFRSRGSPPVWDVPYQVGGMLAGSGRWGLFRLAAMNSALGSEPAAWELNGRQDRRMSGVAHLSFFVVPSFTTGLSYAEGPYLNQNAKGLGPGPGPVKKANDFMQRVVGAHFVFKYRRLGLFAEVFHDTWETPNLTEPPTDTSFYIESKVKLLAGTFVAARVSSISFSKVEAADGTKKPWDDDAKALQLALGGLVTRSIGIKTEYGVKKVDAVPETKTSEHAAIEISYRF